jgi:WD40 repeat protein
VKHLTFHPDGVRLLVSSYRTTLAVWDTFAGEVLRHYRFDGWTDGVAVRPDGSEFAVHTHGGRALRWGFGDVEPRPLSVLPRPGSASTLEYDPGGGHLWSIGPDFALHRLDLGDDTDAVATVPVANASVTLSFYRASVRPTHNQVASLTGGRIAIWSADSLELDRIVDHAWGAGSAPFVSYAPGRGTLTLFGQVTRTWSVPDGRLIHTYEFPEFLQHVALSNSGERAIAQVADEVQVFDTTTGEVLLALDQAPTGRDDMRCRPQDDPPRCGMRRTQQYGTWRPASPWPLSLWVPGISSG